MFFSKPKSEFSKLDMRLYLLCPSNTEIYIFDQVYLKEKVDDVKPYSLLTVKGISCSSEGTDYHLVDEHNHRCTVQRNSIYLYKGQDLIKQRIYDDVIYSVLIALMAAGIAIVMLNPDLLKYTTIRYGGNHTVCQ